MVPTLSTTSISFFFFFCSAQKQLTEIFILNDVVVPRPEEPSLVVAGTEWSSALTFEGVELGWYWIVVCVSLKNLDYSKLFTMNFLTQRKSAGQDEWYITVRGGGPFFFFLV